ncbi:hypothetical protein O1R50_22660 [Glycomyces luteolus]|uniref:Uncharacterized protein n=1 Tax=Glycomyces luteolus TaxID=2670330 RepID=A0A9X3STN8_9ACTN|nr:hypothetical protein [Glycomyces luteolus]MDA1362444.1 hypothetical protein [Glycomyces luteolus]
MSLTEADQAHATYCSFQQWFAENEPGTPMGTITCSGYVPQEYLSDGSSTQGFTCKAPELITATAEWAALDRDWILERIPKFASPQIPRLRAARDAFGNASQACGAFIEGGDSWDMEGSFSLELDGLGSSLAEAIGSIAYVGQGSSPSWMVGWTGAAADEAAAGFFHTISPTLNNHALIANALGYLINLRATIIDENRRNTLDLIGSATESLGATATTDVDLTKRWAVVEGIGAALALTGPGAAIGAPIAFVGWLGSQLKPTKKDTDFKSEPQEVASGLADAFDEMKRDIEYSEADYRTESQTVENAIGSARLETLELYDITQNNPEGTSGQGGNFSADIDVMTNLAQVCYGIADAYEELRSQLGDVYSADSHMVDQDGNPTDADTRVQAMREDFLNFISTTIGRYCLAGEQIEKAARSYAESDSEAAASFESWEESLESNQQGSPLSGSEAEELAEATDRTSEPGTQPEAAEGEPEIAYDPEGWDHPAPEPQQGTA